MTLVTVRWWLSVDSFSFVFCFDARYLTAKESSTPDKRRHLSIAPLFSHRLYKYHSLDSRKRGKSNFCDDQKRSHERGTRIMLTENHFSSCIGPETIVCLLVMRVYRLAVSYVRCMFFLKESTFTRISFTFPTLDFRLFSLSSIYLAPLPFLPRSSLLSFNFVFRLERVYSDCPWILFVYFGPPVLSRVSVHALDNF